MRAMYSSLCILAFGIVGILADVNRGNLKTSNVGFEESFVSQQVDHFSSLDNRTFEMRFLTQSKYFSDNGPILIMIGGQWKANYNFIGGGYLDEIGEKVNAYLVQTEHRYYGDSKVTDTLGTYNLRFIKTEQVLADIVGLVKSMKKQNRFKNSKVIVFGGSHGGSLATWLRLKHPDLIDGAVASSATVLAKVDFFESFEAIQNALADAGGPQCPQVIKDAITDARILMQTDIGVGIIAGKFRLCNPIDRLNPLDVQSFYYMITQFMTNIVMNSSPRLMKQMCTILNDPFGTPMDRLFGVFEYFGGIDCNVADYKTILKGFSNTDVSSETASNRIQLYQACTQFGQFQTTTSANQPFGNTLPLRYFLAHLCPDAFGIGIGIESAESGAAMTNFVYGGLNPNVTKVVWTHGSVDPWLGLGITTSLNEESPAIVAEGASHCPDFDIRWPSESVAELKDSVKKLVMKWISMDN